jgi:hypothetical protein
MGAALGAKLTRGVAKGDEDRERGQGRYGPSDQFTRFHPDGSAGGGTRDATTLFQENKRQSSLAQRS